MRDLVIVHIRREPCYYGQQRPNIMRGTYLANHDLRLCAILIRKNASRSIGAALTGQFVESVPDGYKVLTCIRHPWDRVVSALYSTLRSLAPLDERLYQYLSEPRNRWNSHLRPQSDYLNGVAVTHWLRYETLSEDWKEFQRHYGLPSLENRGEGKHRPKNWWDAPIDWDRWYPIYQEDFKLCPEWSHLPGK